MPSRRRILRATVLAIPLALAGCLGDGDDAARSPTGTESRTGGPPDAESPTDTGTPMALPEDCPRPDFEAPALPADRTVETMTAFAREFERAFQRENLPADERMRSTDVDEAYASGDGFLVDLRAHAEIVTTPDGTATATEPATDSLVWDATYRIADATVERTLSGVTDENPLETDCWTVETASDSD